MKTLLKLVLFSFLVIGAYTLFGTEYVPQGAVDSVSGNGVIVAPGPESVKTVDDLIALGKKVFNGNGSCTLCHNSRGRAPLLDEVALRAARRIKETDYRGKARSAEEYIIESMREPSAYVVKGFGVPGAKGGVVSPMPVVTGAEIGLTETEVRAVAAYLLDEAGLEVTVTPSRARGP